MEQTELERRRSFAKAGIIVVLLMAAAGAAVSIMGMQSMGAKPVTAPELRQATPTQLVDVALEISSAQANRYSGTVLESSGKNTYRRMAGTLSFALSKNASLIMGRHSDLRPGAVVIARGRVQSSALADVSRVVVLTDYVQVQ